MRWINRWAIVNNKVVMTFVIREWKFCGGLYIPYYYKGNRVTIKENRGWIKNECRL